MLPDTDTKLAVLGSSNSTYMGVAFDRTPEGVGMARVDAVVAAELAAWATREDVLVIFRSGTTTDVLRTLDRMLGRSRITTFTAESESPVVRLRSGSQPVVVFTHGG